MLVLATTLGCDRPDTSLAPPPDPEDRARVDAGATSPTTVRFELDENLDPTLLEGTPRIVVEEVASDRRIILDLDGPISWPFSYELPDQFSGRLKLILFYDRGDDGDFNDCPFPPGPFDAEVADEVDNYQGVLFVNGPRESERVGTLTRRICGPGPIDTGLTGEIADVPDGVDLWFSAQAQGSTNADLDSIALTTPLTLVANSSGTSSFSVGELLPGRYRIVIFSDDDGDVTPSPCRSGPGGGDRYVVTFNEVEIISGTRKLIEPIRYQVANCPERLTGISGTISATDDLIEASRTVSPLGLLSGPLRIRLVRTDEEGRGAVWTVQPSVDARPFPLRYTVTGIDEGDWSVTAFLDRDKDEQFKPCDAIPAGFDAVSGFAGQAVVANGEISELDTLELAVRSCGMNPRSGITGDARVEAEDGPVGSGRSIRMVAEPTGLEGEAVNAVIFQNHQDLLGQSKSFTQELSPGTYIARLFLDNDRNGLSTRCDETGYGDRQESDEFEFELEVGALLDLGRLSLRSHSCPVPPSRATIAINPPAILPLQTPPPLLVDIEENGGWRSTSQDIPIVDMNQWILGAYDLAPGNYTFTVFTDDDGNGEFTPCDLGEGDQYGATFLVELGSLSPTATIELELDFLCTNN